MVFIKSIERFLQKTINKVITNLLRLSQPEEGCFIGAYDLCATKNAQRWVDRTLKNYSKDSSWRKNISKEELESVIKHFQENVKGSIVDEDHFLTNEDIKNEVELDDKFEMEKPYSIDKLPKSAQKDVPANMKYFSILPVDYNRGTTDIGIAYMTDEGKKYYGTRLTGDY